MVDSVKLQENLCKKREKFPYIPAFSTIQEDIYEEAEQLKVINVIKVINIIKRRFFNI